MAIDVSSTYERIVNVSPSRGVLREILEDGTLVVASGRFDPELIYCDFLITSQGERPTLEPGSLVLYIPPGDESSRGCVLGVIGKFMSVDAQGEKKEETDVISIRKKNIEIVADSQLTIKCGQGALTITEDGTIVIRGARILSRSRGVNKIKGASVQIN